MTTFRKTTGGLAILSLMFVGAFAFTQSANKKSANPPASATASDSANQKTKSNGSMLNIKNNPLYKESNREGTNPLYERDSALRSKGDANSAQSVGSADRQNAQAPRTSTKEYQEGGKNDGTAAAYADTDDNDPSRHHPSGIKTTKVQPPANNVSHETVEYKDPEDMTTRYRPGNNKTTKTVTPASPPSSPNVVEYKDGEDGTMHTRPGNNKVSAAEQLAPTTNPHVQEDHDAESKQMHHSRPSSSSPK